MTQNKNKRLLALDILRGITIAGMILVNNPGSWGNIYAPLGHAQWNGLTPTDLVFPFFMFIMGISTYFSLIKYNFEFSRDAAKKILKRTLVIFAIGLGIAWFGLFIRTWNSLGGEELSLLQRLYQSVFVFENLRILGVMQRLSLTYCATALIALSVKHKYIPHIIVGILIVYAIILLWGNGFEYNETNILSIVDKAILGENHMYKDNGIDPEGLLSTLPAIAHVLLGFHIGRIFTQKKDIHAKVETLFIAGTILTFSGFLLSYGCPINKKIWSPTFVLTTCGLASTLLGLLIWIIDIKGYKKWSTFFESFGVNPLFIYVTGALLTICFGSILFPYGDGVISIHGFLYGVVLKPILGAYNASLAYAILFVTLNWIIGYQLYKRKIFIKI